MEETIKFNPDAIISPEIFRRRHFTLPKEYTQLKLEKRRESETLAGGKSRAPAEQHEPTFETVLLPTASTVGRPLVVAQSICTHPLRQFAFWLWRQDCSWTAVASVSLPQVNDSPRLAESPPLLLVDETSVCVKQFYAARRVAANGRVESEIKEQTALCLDIDGRTEEIVTSTQSALLFRLEASVSAVFAACQESGKMYVATCSQLDDKVVTSLEMMNYSHQFSQAALTRLATLPGAIHQMRCVDNSCSVLLLATQFLYLCFENSGGLRRIPLGPEILVEPLLKCVLWSNSIFLMALHGDCCRISMVNPDGTIQTVLQLPLPRDFHTGRQKDTESIRLAGPKIRLVNSRNAVEWSFTSGRVAKAKRFGFRPRDFTDFLDKLVFGFK